MGKKLLVTVCVVLMVLVAALACAVRAADEGDAVAMVTGIKKELKVVHKGHDMPGSVGMDLFVGDTLKTGTGCQAVIALGDGSEIKLNQNTEITLKAFNAEKKSIFVKLGEIFGKFVPQTTKVNFETPRGVAGIEGTEFNLKVDNNEDEVTVNEGVVSVNEEGNAAKAIKVTAEHGCTLKKGQKLAEVRARFPEWYTRIRQYSMTLKDIDDTFNQLKGRKDLRSLSEDELKAMIGLREKLATELTEVRPPGAFKETHLELEQLNGDSIKTLNLALQAQKHPKSGASAGLDQEVQNRLLKNQTDITSYVMKIRERRDILKQGFDRLREVHEKLNKLRKPLTPDQKQKLQQLKEKTPDQKERLKQQMKERFDKMTPEQKQKFQEQMKERFDQMTPEQKEKLQQLKESHADPSTHPSPHLQHHKPLQQKPAGGTQGPAQPPGEQR
jgi:hypothetical protein